MNSQGNENTSIIPLALVECQDELILQPNINLDGNESLSTNLTLTNATDHEDDPSFFNSKMVI